MKILLLDIETMASKVWAWEWWNTNVGLPQVIEPGRMICWAAKWHNRKKILFRSEHHDGTDVMLQEMWDLLNEADVVVTYNGKKFDIPHINREFLKAGMGPPSPYRQVDLRGVVKKHFRFPSNKLQWICTELELGSKIAHEGMEMWKDCDAGKPKAWRKMRKYNRQDVVLLEDLYDILLPWIVTHPNWGVYLSPDKPICRHCGSSHIQKRGFSYTNMRKYQRYQCTDCGAWSRSNKCVEKVSDGLTY